MQRMTDPLNTYEIFLNGHARFMTKSSRAKMTDSQVQAAHAFGSFQAPFSYSSSSSSYSLSLIHI